MNKKLNKLLRSQLLIDLSKILAKVFFQPILKWAFLN